MTAQLVPQAVWERLAYNGFALNIIDELQRRIPEADHDIIEDVVRDQLGAQGPVFPLALTAMMVEQVVWGDVSADEEPLMVEGFTGRALQKVIDDLIYLASREQTFLGRDGEVVSEFTKRILTSPNANW